MNAVLKALAAAGLGPPMGIHDFQRKLVLGEREQITHQHRESPVARQRDHLAAGEGGLDTDPLGHRIGHRPVPERAQEPPLAVHRQIARRPHRRQAHVAGEDGVLCRQIADRLRHLLRVDQPLSGRTHGELVKRLARFGIMSPRLRTVGLLIE
jgi:hypothetical protein